MRKLPSSRAPSCAVDKYIGTDFDSVKIVAENIQYIIDVADGIKGLPIISYIAATPPANPLAGAEWFCTVDGRTYIWYVTSESSQWVEDSPQSQIVSFAQSNTASLNNKLASINTLDKYAGKLVFNLVSKCYVYAVDSYPTSVWKNFDNSVAHTPV